MTDRRRVIDDKELLSRLENDRQDDLESGNGSSSLQSIVNDDIKNNLSFTKLLPLIVTFVGGLYIAVTQIYTFTTSISDISNASKENREVITELTETQMENKLYLESLVNDHSKTLDERVLGIENALRDMERRYDNSMNNISNDIERIRNNIASMSSDLRTSTGEQRNQISNISSRVSEIETEIRIMKIQYEFNSGINSNNN